MTAPLSISQPGLVLAQSIVTNGIYPVRQQPYGDVSADALGMIITTAFNPNQVAGLTLAAGQTMMLNTGSMNDALFTVIGSHYGASSSNSFTLPNLSGAAMLGYSTQDGPSIGSFQGMPGNELMLEQSQLPYTLGGFSEPLSNAQFAQTLQYIIQVDGLYPEGYAPTPYTMGTIYAFAGDYIPNGFAACDGSLVSISENQALFSLIGTTFGGDGMNNFQLPNLSNALPVGAGGQYQVGEMIGVSATSLYTSQVPNAVGAFMGQAPISTMQPSLALNYIINIEGAYNYLSDDSALLGQVTMYAGFRPPEGWVMCEGQSLSISEYPALYNLLGTAFGGDGITSFALPDLRDRTIIGSNASDGLTIGQSLGEASAYITVENLPEIFVPTLGLSLANDTGTSGTDHVTNAVALNVLGLWPGAQLQYSTDGQTWTTTYQAHHGANSLWVRQMDVLGQTSKASQLLQFTLDSTAPVTPTVNIEYGLAASRAPASSVLLAPALVPSTDTGSLRLGNLESGAVVTYSTDGGFTWSEHFEATTGLNRVQVRQTDQAGNASAASTVLSFLWTGSAEDAPGTGVFSQQHGLTLAADQQDVVLSGLGAGNTVTGNALNNLIEVLNGSWIVDGGQGRDTVRLAADLADYRIDQQTVDASSQVTLIGPTGKLVLQNIEAIEFGDGTLVQTADALVGDLYALYQTIFERNPDFAGLKFWHDALDTRASLTQVAASFLASEEFSTQTGPQSTADFVAMLYYDILGRNADASGVEFWTAQIDEQHASRADVLLGVLQSNEAVQLLGDSGSTLLILG